MKRITEEIEDIKMKAFKIKILGSCINELTTFLDTHHKTRADTNNMFPLGARGGLLIQ
jgi:hypothetical protein